MAFCDWLTMYQDHHGVELPRINDGAIWAVDSNGEVSWTTEKKFTHVGSYDTKIRIKCDGNRVSVDGNISRFNRADNVFGFSVSRCIELYNALLADYGLPPFTSPRFDSSSGRLSDGAIITRVDLTKNYVTGSHSKAVRLVHYLGGQDGGRRATVKQYGDNGVTWNEGSKYQSSKLYIKAESLGEHCHEQTASWVRNSGLVRHEISLKSRYLAQKKLNHINDWIDLEGTEMDNVIYNRFTEVLHRGTALQTEIDHIPGRIGCLASAWRAGKDLWGDESVGRSTRRRWRKELLPFGIDIKQPSNIHRLNTRLEIITLQEAEAPAFYWNKAA